MPFPSFSLLPLFQLQAGQSHALRLHTNLWHLHVAESDDQRSLSTVREQSSPASVVDFQGMAGHFAASSFQRDHDHNHDHEHDHLGRLPAQFPVS